MSTMKSKIYSMVSPMVSPQNSQFLEGSPTGFALKNFEGLLVDKRRLKNFNINHTRVSQFSSTEEKESYIKNKLMTRFMNDLKKMYSIIEKSKSRRELEELKFNQKQKKQNNKNLYSWLKLDSK